MIDPPDDLADPRRKVRLPLHATGPRRAARLAWRVALLLAPLALAALPAQPPARAQQPGDWTLDSFEVHYFRRGVKLRSELIPAAGTGSFDRRFKWQGRQDYGEAHPKGAILMEGVVQVGLPDRFQPGERYTIKVDAVGSVDTPGRDPASTDYDGSLGLELKCFDTTLCYSRDAQMKVIEPGTKLDLAVDLPGKTFTLPTDPSKLGNMLMKIQARLASSLPNDDDWSVDIYPVYKAPEPTPVPAFKLELDSDTPRLPPSGAAASTARISATVRRSDGSPLAGERVQLALDPPDMGRLLTASGVTDAQGRVTVTYQAPTAAQLAGRSAVTVIATVPARGLRQALALAIERYRLTLTVDPTTVPAEAVWRAIRVGVRVQDFDGRPVAGDEIQFRVDPPDLGEVIGSGISQGRAKTDAAGRVDGFFEPAPPSRFNGRDQLTLYAANLSHGGEEGVVLRFPALRVRETWPFQDARDVDLQPADAIRLDFDRALDPATVTERTVKLETLWHGNLGATVEASGASLLIRPGPIPKVGLRVKVTVAGGEDGVKGSDGSVMLGPYRLHFRTLPELKPRIVVSQVVDEPREPVFDRLTVAPKPFSVRVEAGLSKDSELDHEAVEVTLSGLGGGEESSLEQRFYPGRWPPLVPDSALPHGNAALFGVDPPPKSGSELVLRAALRPAFAPQDKTVDAPPVTLFVNHWSGVAQATSLNYLALPIVNESIPPFDWRVSRGQMERWVGQAATEAGRLLPLNRLGIRLGYLSDTTCLDTEKCLRDQPATHYAYWVRMVGRAGFFTRGFHEIVALVPPNFFDSLAELPEAQAKAEIYHHAWISGIWSQRRFDPAFPPSSAWPVSLVQVGEPGAVIAHALGDRLNLPHSSAAQDTLAGYDAAADQMIVCDDERCTGPSVSVMNDQVGFGPTWISRADYNGFLDHWTSRSTFNPLVKRRSPRPAALAQAEAQPVLVVSGALLRAADGRESGSLDPLLSGEGRPSLSPTGAGDHAVELRDAAGASLGRYPFQPVFEPAGAGAQASFLCAVPADARTAEALITRGAVEILSRRRSARAPTVRFSSPAAGSRLSGEVAVAWEGQDADGDALTYQLQFSPDGGASWMPLLLDSAATRFSLRSVEVGNGPDVRLRLVAGDGFHSTTAELALALDNPQQVLAVQPPEGARGVSPRSQVEARLRDPLDPASVTGDALTLYDPSGHAVSGSLAYDPVGVSLIFSPAQPLLPAARYEARLAGWVRRPDGRSLGADWVWFFSTRGRQLYLPFTQLAGRPAAATAAPSPVPTRAPTGAATRRPEPTAVASPGASATPDRLATAVAATLTALAPRPSASHTPDRVATGVAGTLTALAPPTAASPTATPLGATPGAVTVTTLQVLSTGADAEHRQMAFAPGEAISLWLQAANSASVPVTADIGFEVVGRDGSRLSSLSWSGPVELAAGSSWVRLERTVPTGAPAGPYTLTGRVSYGGAASSAECELYIAGTLRLADGFADAASGWPAGRDAFGSYGYQGGVYVQSFSAAGRARWASPPALPALADFALEADLRLAGTGSGTAALVFGLNADGSDYHIVQVDAGGQYSLFRWSGGAWQTLLSPRASSALLPGAATNHLLLVRRSGLTHLYANGQMITMITDIAAPAGRGGLYGSAEQAGFEAQFDAFRMYRLP